MGPLLRGAERILRDSAVDEIEAKLPRTVQCVRGRLAGTAQALSSSPPPNALSNLPTHTTRRRATARAAHDRQDEDEQPDLERPPRHLAVELPMSSAVVVSLLATPWI